MVHVCDTPGLFNAEAAWNWWYTRQRVRQRLSNTTVELPAN